MTHHSGYVTLNCCPDCHDKQNRIKELETEKDVLERMVNKMWGFQLSDLEWAAKLKEAKPLIKALSELFRESEVEDE